MVKMADVVEVLLHSSVTVKITVDEPVKPQSSLKATKSLLQVYVPHTSEAAPALPLAESQPFKSDRLPAPSHSTVKSMASEAMAGSVVSSMVKVAVVVLVFPHSSVAGECHRSRSRGSTIVAQCDEVIGPSVVAADIFSRGTTDDWRAKHQMHPGYLLRHIQPWSPERSSTRLEASCPQW